MRHIALILLFLPLTGCVFGSLQQLSLIEPDASDFESALAAEYLAFANAESEQGRTLSAEYFAGKGMDAWLGNEVALEEVDSETPAPLRYQLSATRELLTALLIDDVVSVVPQPAARAQLLFDCWVKQSEPDSAVQEGKLCDEDLQTELDTLEDVAVSLHYVSEDTREIPFVSGKRTLGTQARLQIAKILSQISRDTPYVLELSGDTSSKKRTRLFNQRVAEIRKAFRSRGINEAHIRVRDTSGEKTVYLSNDRIKKKENVVTVTVRSFNPPSREEG